jgi:SAM-dependent methyltransferase
MTDPGARFSGVAAAYDAVRPTPPGELVTVITQWCGAGRPDVVDLGAGTGLSAVIWAGRARQVTAIEPAAGMREIAERRIGALPAAGAGPGTRFAVRHATAEDTGLPGRCADVVTASQAMHWFDPDRALPEIARILRPGGVLAAYDCDWPPCVDWEIGAAWDAVADRVEELAARRGLPALHRGKDHLGVLRGSGLFRHCTEIAVTGCEQGDAGRLVALARSVISRLDGFLAEGSTEDDLGITTLREAAARRLRQPRPWWLSYRVRLAVR